MTLDEYAKIAYKHITDRYTPTELEWKYMGEMIADSFSAGDSIESTIQSINQCMNENYNIDEEMN